MITTTNTITSFDQLSLTLNATQVAAVLGISRSGRHRARHLPFQRLCTHAQ